MTTTLRIRLQILGLVSAAALSAGSCRERTEAEAPVATEQKVPVRTAVVETRDLTETLTLTGTLEPRAKVPVGAEVSARLVRLLTEEGDRVAAGALLAVLDDTDLRLARDRAQAAVALAEANRAHTKAEADRAANLLKTGGITDKDRLAAQVAVQIAEASYDQARTELAITEQQLKRTQVTAPLGGRISRRNVDVGTMLAPGTQIVEIVDDGVFELRASVSSSDLPKVRVGQEVGITVDALPGFTTTGRVNRIAPFVDTRSRSFEVVIRFPGESQLVSGLFARADIRVREILGGLTVPPTALLRDGADPTRAQTFVVAGGKAERRDVGVGVERSDAVQVTSGLQAGDVVVIDPPASLGPGTAVDAQPQVKGAS